MTLPAGDDKAAVVEAMFDRIAPVYDRMNRLLTLRLDRRWRRLAAQRLAIGPDDLVIDLGCGTGAMCELAARTGARVVGLDRAARMLERARARRVGAALLRADAARLPLRERCATVVTTAFTLRNVVSISDLLAEAARILRPGGRLALLEVDAPRRGLLRWGHAAYFRRAVPLLGALLAERDADSYLPESATYLPGEAELLGAVAAAGFHAVRKCRLAGGAAQLILAER
jgi:demethylmenaquinone methyltransferase/2-methoxy-6-polyprenyl-1,4-benzoquinol methylase